MANEHRSLGGNVVMGGGRKIQCITVTRRRETVTCAMTLLLTVTIGVLVFFAGRNWIVTSLFLPVILFESFFFGYYASWRVSLSNKDVTITKMFLRRKYSYTQLLDAAEYPSRVGTSVLWLTFSDKKRYCITSFSHNYIKGRKILAAHHTIRKA